MRRMVLFLTCLLCLGAPCVRAQDPSILLNEARQLEQSFKDEQALKKYLEILRLQPRDVAILCRCSELYSRLGKKQAQKSQQDFYYNEAYRLAKEAYSLAPNNAEANFVMSVSMGRLAMVASGEDKINAVRDIKKFAERSIQLDPASYKGYHVMGKWYYEVSNLSSFEKWLVKMVYGSLPPATLNDAIRQYEKSRQLYPGLLLNYLELAKAYHKKDELDKARALLQQLLKLPDSSSDDAFIRNEARTLLKKWAK